MLVVTLFTLGDYPRFEIVKESYERRSKFEVDNNGYKYEVNSFNRALKNLLGAFINSSVHGESHQFIAFSNPSINDF
jgi:hypothetical protein